MIDATTVLYLDRNSLLAHCNHEIDLGLAAALGEMSHVQIHERFEEITRHAFGQMPSEVGEVRSGEQPLGSQGYYFLKPRRPQGVIAKANLGGPSTPLQAELQGFNQTHQESSIQELQIGHHPLWSDVSIHSSFDFFQIKRRRRRLPGIPTGKAENFLQQMLISFLTLRSQSKVMLDRPSDDGFVKEVSYPFPGLVDSCLRDRISSPLGKS